MRSLRSNKLKIENKNKNNFSSGPGTSLTSSTMDKSAAETIKAQQQMIETLQQQIAATTIDNKTPFYHCLIKNPQAVGDATTKVNSDGSNFEMWQSDMNSVMALAFPGINNFLNLEDNFDTLTPNKEVVVQTEPDRILKEWNEIGAAFLDFKLSNNAILGLFLESTVKGPNTVEANLFHQNVQAILNKEDKVPTFRKTIQVIWVEYRKIKHSAGTFDDPIAASRAAVIHPILAHNPVNTQSPEAKAKYGDTCVVCKGTSHWYIDCPLYEKQYIETDIATPEVVTENMANTVDEGVIMLDTGANK
ncbi:hypothetical protein PPACK8108_LOCUS23156 [Phakopsora pachyrhizi]|uniref:Retrotransposon Copia-like N-terminal domain-containing protein n=1 Tax=Phakopsora pachyrhizi TaxID=170000 RepID=A0AAV0BNZ0_PHAPC|nr:hypothetical protein PPACK8108_LOCUS23156 [Phakopsora pachyrhizi]